MPSFEEYDLRWLLDGSAAAELGEKSSFASFIAQVQGGGGGGGNPELAQEAENYRLDAVRRARVIKEALERCSKTNQRVLLAYYNPEKVDGYWAKLTHVLPLTGKYNEAKHGPISSGIGLRMALANATPEQRDAVTRLRRAAEELVAAAHAEYRDLAAAVRDATAPRPPLAAE